MEVVKKCDMAECDYYKAFGECSSVCKYYDTKPTLRKRYIDADKIVLKLKRYLMPNVDIDGTVSVENAERYFLKLLQDAPTADVAEVKYGYWEIVKDSNGKEKMVCTNCRHQQDLHSTFTYCPDCGAFINGRVIYNG